MLCWSVGSALIGMRLGTLIVASVIITSFCVLQIQLGRMTASIRMWRRVTNLQKLTKMLDIRAIKSVCCGMDIQSK